jgi:protein-disulfide isomerase
MSSRQASKAAARQTRIAAQARARAAASRRRRMRLLTGVGLIALVTVAVAVSISGQGGTAAGAATGGQVAGAAYSSHLLAGIPQRGIDLGRADAPVRLVEFADLQCPYCDQYALRALPTLVEDYVRRGKLQMRFENLSFIGPDSIAAGRMAAAAAQQDRLWNFLDLMYLNQGEENTGYVTGLYLRRLAVAVPGLDVARALATSRSPGANAALARANQIALDDGVDATPSFLIGRAGGPLRPFTPSSLTPEPFVAAIEQALR